MAVTTKEAEAAVAARAGAQPHPRTGLRGKLWVAYVLQIAAISAATLLSVYVAWIVLRDVLIQRALVDEARHYVQRLERDPQAPAPDTFNMQAYLRRPGTAAEIPDELRELPLGYHAMSDRTRMNDLVYVSETPQGRLYLVFKQEQVDSLALWFGFVPLTVVLLMIYLTTWLTYRVSRRMISPVIWLASQVRAWDPKRPDFHGVADTNLPSETDADVRALAQSLHALGARIEEFVERERNFTRDASHELRTPLTVIKVAADVLLSDGELKPFAERSAGRIQRAARDMEALIEAFLILAREGDVGLPEQDFVVNEVVADEIDKAQALVEGKPVTLHVVEEAHFALHAPMRALAVLLSNLLRNACLYTEQGSVTVTVGRDFVSVQDTGVGMSRENLARAFEPFFRGNQTGSRGHGIGLNIVQRLSARFGWPIQLDSELGVGTRATVRFPNPQPI